MKSDARERSQALLLLPLFVYLLLPMFGSVWHNVVPEHDHFFTAAMLSAGVQAADIHDEGGHAACEACGSAQLAPYETVVHAFDPVSALQIFGIIVSFGALFTLIFPRGLLLRIVWPALFLKSPLLAPLELPPASSLVS